MSKEQAAVRLEGVGIEYHLNLNGGARLRREGIRAFQSLGRHRRKSEFWALKDVSVEIKKGEIFGILGGNGAGKSTLLKAVAGIIPPTEGKIEREGTIAPLIELGAAINPELTGAENIFLAGSLYRVPRKEIQRAFDEIVDFAGLRKFIHTPVKNYSSGMFVRLAFSTIIFFKPDIVLIDEVFSVGDQVFQQKSFEKILGFKERGATIVLVSHDLGLLSRICTRALVLSRGRGAFIGPVEEAVGRYRQIVQSGELLDGDIEAKREEGGTTGSSPTETKIAETALDPQGRWGNRKVEILSVSFVDGAGHPKKEFTFGERFEARIAFASKLGPGEKPVFGAAVATAYKMLIYGPNTLENGWPAEQAVPAKGIVKFIIPELPLFPGEYLFSAAVYDETLGIAFDHHELAYSFRVTGGPKGQFGTVKIKSSWELDPVI